MAAQKIQRAKILPKVLKPMLHLGRELQENKRRFEFDKAWNIFVPSPFMYQKT